jgi:hypothetical protein
VRDALAGNALGHDIAIAVEGDGEQAVARTIGFLNKTRQRLIRRVNPAYASPSASYSRKYPSNSRRCPSSSRRIAMTMSLVTGSTPSVASITAL